MSDKFSISRVNLFLQNPWKHWCKYMAGYKPKYNPKINRALDRGTVFHKGMEYLSQGKATDYDSVMKLLVDEYWDKGFDEYVYTTVPLAMERYLEHNKDNLIFDRVIETEYKLEYTLPSGNQFIGYIDAIIQNKDGSVTLVDYKTYSSAPQEFKLKYSTQANMYMEVATRLGFKVKGFCFDCVNPKEKVTGRNYKTKRIKFKYNKLRGEDTLEQFDELTKIINSNPNYRIYVPGDYQPDAYDTLYQVYIGDYLEDFDEHLAKYFEPFDESGIDWEEIDE